jgi:hypothetical protein
LSNEPIIPFQKPRPEQLTIDQVRALSSTDIDRARLGGHLEDLMMGKKPAPPPAPAPTSDPTSELRRQLARELVDKAGL